MIKMTLT